MSLPWQGAGGDAAEGEYEGPTHEEMLAVAKRWDRDTEAANRAHRRRKDQRAAGGGGRRGGAGHPFWDRKIAVASGEDSEEGETITARGTLKRALAAPEGYTAGFDGFVVKTLEGRRICIGNDKLGRAFHVRFGRKLVERDPAAAYCGTFVDGGELGAVAYAGPRSGEDASRIVSRVARAGGGRPDRGGSGAFAQAGGMDESKRDTVNRAALGVLVE